MKSLEVSCSFFIAYLRRFGNHLPKNLRLAAKKRIKKFQLFQCIWFRCQNHWDIIVKRAAGDYYYCSLVYNIYQIFCWDCWVCVCVLEALSNAV